jgi:TRAP-type mannitol/chloroaromatic compound transport system substrate-binding protein
MELIMKADRWDALSDTTKAQVNAACEMTTIESFTEWSKKDLDAVVGMSAKDQAKVVRISDELLNQIVAAGRTWGETKAAEKAKTGDTFMQEVITSYYDFMESWNATSKFRGL